MPRARTSLPGRITGLLLAATLTTAGLSLPARGAAPDPDSAGQQTRVIVRLSGEPALARTTAGLADRRAAVETSHRALSAAAEKAGVEAENVRSFTGLINAVAMTVGASDVSRLRTLPGVTDVVPDQRMRASTDVSVPLVGAPEVWKQQDPAGKPGDGTGTTLAIVDTGIDYTNPSLGGAFGEGHKVVAGHDFVNGDDDPADDNGHGTHVAGIAAGSGEVTGVAPGAELTAYKVLDDGGAGWESDIIAGLEAAVDPANPHRADVVNLSLGGPGDGTEPLGQAATAATKAGVVVVAAAGNSGPGEQTAGTPAVAEGVVAVGASTSGIRLPQARLVSPRSEPLQTYRAPYSASPPEQPVTGQLVDVGKGTAADYDRVGDVTGKVVAYRASIPGNLGDVSPALIEQARLAEDRGALALIAYTSGGGPVLAAGKVGTAAEPEPGVVDIPIRAAERSGESFRMDRLVVLGLAALQWEQLVRDLAAGPVSIAISGKDVTDQVASFSSRGPTSRYALKPDLVAPGVEIRSTWPLQFWAPGVYRISGTSMASPHVAGAAALVRQMRPAASVTEIGSRLIGSAKGVAGAMPAVAGAGRLDVAAAASAALVASPTSVSMGLADLGRNTVSGTRTVTITNTSSSPVNVRLRAENAGIGTSTVSPSTATIPAGGRLPVSVSVSAARPATDANLTGTVIAEADGGQHLRVPYLLAVRQLVVQTSPDPSDGTSAAFISTPAPLSAPPVLTVTPQHGHGYDVTARLDHGSWYRADLHGDKAGVYKVAARAWTSTGQRLIGAGSFEVIDAGGPGQGARWEPIGPNGASGRIATTQADSRALAVTQSAKTGPWTTADSGRSWEQHNRLPVAGGTGTVVIDARDKQTMWYAVNGLTKGLFGDVLDPTYQGRMLRTRDGGKSWTTLDFPDLYVHALVSDPRTRMLAAVTTDSILISRDRGEHWSSYPSPVGDDLADAQVAGSDLYLSSTAGVWAVRGIVTGDPTGTEQVYDAGEGRVDGMVADDQLVAVLTGNDDIVGSRDDGASWNQLYAVPGKGALDVVMRNGDVMVSTYTPSQYVGRDHGTSWSPVAQPVAGAIENDFTQWKDGLLWSSPGAGLFSTAADGTGSKRIGVPGVTAYDLAVTQDPAGQPRLLAGTTADVFSTALPTGSKFDSSASEWGLSGYEAYVGTRVGQLATSPQDPKTVWKIRKDALSQFWVYRSTDGGKTWVNRGRTDEVPFDIAVAPDDPNKVVVPFWSLGGSGLYVTTNAGTTWRKYYQGTMFTTVAADPAVPNRLWLGSASGLYRSDDLGQTVEKVADSQVTSVAVAGSRIVAGGGTIRVSTDGGKTFRTADSGSLQMLVSELLVSPSDSRVWYAAAGSFTANGLVKGGRGVLRSTDGGLTWVNVSRGLQNLNVVSLAASADGRWLYAGTVDGGVHRVRAR